MYQSTGPPEWPKKFEDENWELNLILKLTCLLELTAEWTTSDGRLFRYVGTNDERGGLWGVSMDGTFPEHSWPITTVFGFSTEAEVQEAWDTLPEAFAAGRLSIYRPDDGEWKKQIVWKRTMTSRQTEEAPLLEEQEETV